MTKELAVVKDFSVPKLLDREGIAEELDGLNVQFTQVRIPSGGSLAFELPGEDDDEPEVVREITGVIVFHHPVNVYWSEGYDGQHTPPDCYSPDGKRGIGEPGGDCLLCPFNQWGSSEGGSGKACQNRRRIYLYRDTGEEIPLLFSLPPTSLSNFGDFVSRRVLQKGLRTYQVVATAKLKQATSKTGIKYSQVTWRVNGVLADKDVTEVKKLVQSVKAWASGISAQQVEGTDDLNLPSEKDL